MKEQCVSYEVAKLLKEKGFDKGTIHYYFEDGVFIQNSIRDSVGMDYGKDIEYELDEFYENWNDKFVTKKNGDRCFGCPKERGYFETYSAPTLHEVVEWLRVNHGIWISVYRQRHPEDKHYGYVIKQPNEIETKFWGFKSPKEAYLEAIEKALKMIDKKEFKKGGDLKDNSKNKNMSKENEFVEIADYGDQMYFTRDFGHVIVGDDEKEIPLVLVATIENFYEATGDDRFEEKPFIISLNIYPSIEFIDKAHIESCANSAGIEPEEVGYTDLVSYGLGIPLNLKNLEEGYAEMNDAEEFLKSKELKDQLNAQSMLIGFYMDGAINRAGDSRWAYLEHSLDKSKSWY